MATIERGENSAIPKQPATLTFRERLLQVHGERVQKVIDEMGTEVKIIEQMEGHSFPIMNGLLQQLFCETQGGHRNLPQAFDIGGIDPRTYYVRTLTEIPGIDQARVEFEERLAAFIGENPNNRETKRVSVYLESY